MKHKSLLFTLLLGMMVACTGKKEVNPFLTDWNTPFGTPPFGKIENSHFVPAYVEGVKQHEAEIDAIVNNPDEPTFENTLVALDESGLLLDKVSSVFGNLSGADTNEELQRIAKEVSPLVTKHYTNISLNEGLFKRIKTLWDKKEMLELNAEQMRLLEVTYTNFVRGGANLDETQKTRVREINEQLSMLSLQFGDNILAETNSFEMVVENEADLKGLPQSIVASAAEAARQKGYEGKWLFTTQKPSMIPFLSYAENRALREKLYRGYFMRGDNNNPNDNKSIIEKIVALRIERASMFGFENHASFILDRNMAKTPEKVYELLLKVWDAAIPAAKNEIAEMQAIIDSEGGNFKLASWDWWYYAEKVKKQKYDLSEEALMPYFEVNNVRNGVFAVAEKLWGLKFNERTDIEVYHPDVKVFEVTEADGSHIGILYTDYFMRASKRAGAWMSSYRKQRTIDGKMITPLITNVCNYNPPMGGAPSLLTWDDVQTMFHEFGHALHGLLSNCTYNTLSGTSVSRDFVELPSQIMEHWAAEPEVLKMYAFHHKTGDVIPDELIEKLLNASHFNQGFITVEFVAAALLDMDWHTLTEMPALDVNTFETQTMNKYGLMSEIIPRYRNTYFAHIFSGGYSAGYYAYMWAEVLDADAFNAFKENGIFDAVTANKFRDNVLSRGNTDEPMSLYIRFRGQEPDPNALLVNRGLK
jgi:peptidyl-dipeptidase Dcp